MYCNTWAVTNRRREASSRGFGSGREEPQAGGVAKCADRSLAVALEPIVPGMNSNDVPGEESLLW